MHCRFQGEVGLRTGWGAIGTGTRLVGLHYIAADVQVGTAIDAGKMEAAEAGKRIGVCTRIKKHPGLDSGKRPVPLRAEFDGDHRLWRWVPGQQVFVAGIDQSYRLAQAMRYHRRQRLKQRLLPAESPTNRHRLDAHLSLRHLERLGDRRAHIE